MSRQETAKQLAALKKAHSKLKKAHSKLEKEYLDLSERAIALHVLQEMTLKLTSELNLQALLKNILDSAIKVVGAVAGSLLLLDKLANELVFAVVVGGGGETLEGQTMPREKGIAGWVLRTREPLVVDDVNKDKRFYGDDPSGNFHTANLICIPLIARGEAIGVLQVLNKSSGEQFNQNDTDLLMTFAAQSATAIENARLVHALRDERDRIVALEEDVRKRLARDLHDGPTQLLAAIRMGLEFSRKLLIHGPDKVDQELAGLLPVADRALKQVRTLLFDLRPTILETDGLVPALEFYTKQIEDVEKFSIILDAGGFDMRLTSRAEKEIFSAVREAFSNIKKHALAQHVWVTLLTEKNQLVVTVRDDGVGFDTTKINPAKGREGSLGMINMRERAQMLNGEFSITSQVGQGTVVTFQIPLEKNSLESS